jgi:2-dehydro-3-deoxyphosphogluconate aldolase/(4S)-4-hydroxy-2-oxoglutarate aldolase
MQSDKGLRAFLTNFFRSINMAAKDRMAVLSAMMDQSIIPVFYHPDVELCKNVIQACANAGAKCVEFTNRGDFAAHVFYEVTRHFAKADPSVIMGVGSIVDAPTAALFIANGAEIGDAQELGVEIVKVFPGSSVGGPDFVKSVMGPMPWTRIMPTGGVEPTEESLRKWFAAGIVACGIGSNMITKKLLDAKDFQGIEDNVRKTIALSKTIKAELAGK